MNSADIPIDNENKMVYDQKIKLKKPIHLRDMLDEGAIFEPEHMQKEEPPSLTGMKYQFDENVLHKLQCGNYGNEIKNDEYNNSEDSSDDMEPFEKLALNMEDLTPDGGVKKRIVNHGYGGILPINSIVIFKYNAYQEYSDEPFDSSMFQNKPTKVHLGKGNLLPGMEIAVGSMMKTECAHFIIQSKYAYGELGCPPRIPANASLLFEVTVQEVINTAAADAFSHLDDEQVTTVTFSARYDAANAYRIKGNEYFRHEHYSSAKQSYKKGSWVLESTRLENEQQEEQHQILLFTLYTNCAMAFLKMNDPKGACIQCRCAIQLNKYGDDDKVAQLYYRFGEAKRLLHDYQQALRYAHKAFKLKPNDSLIKELINRIGKDAKKAEHEDKILYSSMLGLRSKEDVEMAEKMKRMSLVSADFKSTLRAQLNSFSDESMKNSFISLRSNLTDEEVEYAGSTASACGCSVEIITQGRNKLYRLYKQT